MPKKLTIEQARKKLKKIWIQPTSLDGLIHSGPTNPLMSGKAYYFANIYDYPRQGCIELTIGKIVRSGR